MLNLSQADVTIESLSQNDASFINDVIGFWLAPEILSDGKQGQSEKTDIWALGFVLVEMFTRRWLWPDDDASTIYVTKGKYTKSRRSGGTSSRFVEQLRSG